ncbi:hypothetical protein JW758_01175 [Candidatus Peregrinibacteria bacterium]|nr:hypothetical protein [Candidatus Peregrinibacteria bacterium]
MVSKSISLPKDIQPLQIHESEMNGTLEELGCLIEQLRAMYSGKDSVNLFFKTSEDTRYRVGFLFNGEATHISSQLLENGSVEEMTVVYDEEFDTKNPEKSEKLENCIPLGAVRAIIGNLLHR